MTRSMLGILAAGAVASLVGSTALAAEGGMGMGMEKACYRNHCGKSVKGHEGKCGGTKVDDLTSEKSCMEAGGSWATPEEAKKFEKNKD